MTRIPAIPAKTIIGFLETNGFIKVRQKGIHFSFKHCDGRSAVIPVHQGEDIGRGLIFKILKDAEINRTELMNWLGII